MVFIFRHNRKNTTITSVLSYRLSNSFINLYLTSALLSLILFQVSLKILYSW